jgi:hypothetical protein
MELVSDYPYPGGFCPVSASNAKPSSWLKHQERGASATRHGKSLHRGVPVNTMTLRGHEFNEHWGGTLMRYFVTAVALAAALFWSTQGAQASSLVLAAQSATVDSDGDSVIDLVDNAPGVSNNQADADADGIGDVIDPTPNISNPALGDPGLGVYSSPTISVGGTATFDYLMVTATPPGNFGRVELDFNLDNTTDAVFFGPLDPTINTIAIPASLFVDAAWDLFTPGTYTVGMKAYAPGMHSENWAYPNVTVLPVPEPATLLLGATAMIGLLSSARLWRETSPRSRKPSAKL